MRTYFQSLFINVSLFFSVDNMASFQPYGSRFQGFVKNRLENLEKNLASATELSDADMDELEAQLGKHVADAKQDINEQIAALEGQIKSSASKLVYPTAELGQRLLKNLKQFFDWSRRRRTCHHGEPKFTSPLGWSRCCFEQKMPMGKGFRGRCLKFLWRHC